MSSKKKRRPAEEKIGFHVELLPVKLTDEEMLARGQDMARIYREISEHEAHADAVKSELKTKRAALDAEASRLAGILQRKAELRETGVTHWVLWKTKMYQETRDDSGEVVPGTLRGLRESEKQGDLFKDAAEAAKKALEQAAENGEEKPAKKPKKGDEPPAAGATPAP